MIESEQGATAAPPAAGQPGDDADGAHVVTTGRRRAYTRRRRRAELVMLAVAVAVAVLVPVLAYVAVDAMFESRDGRRLRPERDEALAVLPDTPAALLAQVDDEGTLRAATVLARSAGGQGGSVILVPLGVEVDVPGEGPEQLRDAFEQGGERLLGQAVEGLLGARLSAVEVVTPERWRRWVEPVGGVPIELPERVDDVDDDGTLVRVLPAGARRVRPDEVAALLAARGEGEVELARLVRHQWFWDAWLGLLGDGAAGAPLPDGGRAGELVTSIAAGTAEVVTLPVERAPAPGDGGDGDGVAETPSEERYVPVVADLRLLVARAMPGAVSPSGTGPRVQLLDPTGRHDVALTAARRLVFAGAQLVIASDIDDDVGATTRVVYYSSSAKAGADLVRRALQAGEIVQEDQRVEGLDVTVVIGRDLRPPVTTTTTRGDDPTG